MDTLKVVGKWLDQFGETIYGTRQGPVTPKSWGVTTLKDNRIFVHILNAESNQIVFPKLNRKIKSVILYHSKEKVVFIESKLGTIIEIPGGTQGMPDVVMEMVLI